MLLVGDPFFISILSLSSTFPYFVGGVYVDCVATDWQHYIGYVGFFIHGYADHPVRINIEGFGVAIRPYAPNRYSYISHRPRRDDGKKNQTIGGYSRRRHSFGST
jgi:hypothetical protein